jgi:HrpA-like RNA helicase
VVVSIFENQIQARKKAQEAVVASLEEAGVWEKLLDKAGLVIREELPLKAEQEFVNRKPKAKLRIGDELCFAISDAKQALESAHLEIARQVPVQHRQTIRSRFHLPQKGDRHFTPPNHTMRQKVEERLSQSRQKARDCKDPDFKRITKAMRMLPMRSKSFAQPLVDLIENNTYSIVVAETGSGKSTQIPQLLLDAAIDKSLGADCQVLCVQPRRIAAKSLAHRVAEERREKVGESVGYILRDDSVRPMPGGNITFCTSGILLMMLRGGLAVLGKYSHIILDEVHVRDAPLDLIMMLIKTRMEQLQSAGLRVPKITVMSATVDVNLFSSYFSTKAPDGSLVPAPHITVPGRTFDVNRHHLEEVLEEITHNLTPDALSGLFQEPTTKNFLDVHFKAFGEPEEKDTTTMEQELPAVSSLDGRTVPWGLISAAVLSVMSSTKAGSILVFVPGMQDILAVEKYITEFGPGLGLNFDDNRLFRLVKLHSQLPEEQLELNRKLPHGCRRVIIATEIAEASLTIPDVRYVIDSGKVSQVGFKALTSTESLAPCWISQNAAFQRAGRAGRVQAGDYYFLGLQKRFDSLPTSRASEIGRMDLQPLCLQVKRSTPGIRGSISELLGQFIEPPESSEVDIAIAALKDSKALEENEEVTDLGHALDDLNIQPKHAKLVVLGVIFQCLDPMVIFAAFGGHMNFFVRATNSDMAQKIKESREAFAPEAASSHYEYIQAFRAVREVQQKQGSEAAARFAHNRYINFREFKSVLRETERIMELLSRARITPEKNLNTQTSNGRLGDMSLNTNSDHLSLITALVTHCLSHNLAVKFPGRTQSKSKYKRLPAMVSGKKDESYRRRQFMCIYNYLWSSPSQPTVMRETANVRPLTAALFGNRLERGAEGDLILNDWANLAPITEHNHDKILEDLVQLHKVFNEVSTALFLLSIRKLTFAIGS